MLHLLIMVVAIVAAGALLWATIGQIDAGRERELRRLAARRRWSIPEVFDWDRTTLMARSFGVDVTLEIRARRVVARTELEGERGLIRRRNEQSGTSDELAAIDGLVAARTGEAELDQRWELFSETGDAPSWLTPVLRRGLLSLREPATVTKDEDGFRLELARRTQDPALLCRLVEVAAAAAHPDAALPEAERIAKPIRSSASIWWRVAMVELVVLPVALIALYFEIRPAEVATLELVPPGEMAEVEFEVRSGDVIEVWQDARFDVERWRSKARPALRLDIQAMDGTEGQRLQCNPYMVNNCTVERTVGKSTTLIHGEDCYLSECGTLRADRPGALRVRARLLGEDRSNPYVLHLRLRLKRRGRWLTLEER